MIREIESFSAVIGALNEDILICIEMLDKEHSLDPTNKQFWRRSFVRALFSHIEGTNNYMKRAAAQAGHQQSGVFSIPELALLSEEVYDLDDKGEVIIAPAKIGIAKNIRFAFQAFARSASANYKLKVSDAGWASFKKGLKIRDRLMHPRSTSDLIVSDDEMLIIHKASKWFSTSLGECLNCVIAARTAELNKLKAVG